MLEPRQGQRHIPSQPVWVSGRMVVKTPFPSNTFPLVVRGHRQDLKAKPFLTAKQVEHI